MPLFAEVTDAHLLGGGAMALAVGNVLYSIVQTVVSSMEKTRLAALTAAKEQAQIKAASDLALAQVSIATAAAAAKMKADALAEEVADCIKDRDELKKQMAASIQDRGSIHERVTSLEQSIVHVATAVTPK